MGWRPCGCPPGSRVGLEKFVPFLDAQPRNVAGLSRIAWGVLTFLSKQAKVKVPMLQLLIVAQG